MRASPDIDRTRTAFSILEMLAAAGILALLVVLLAQTVHTVGNAWSKGEQQVQSRESGRAILDFITPELRAALLPVNPADKTSLQFLVKPDGLSSEFLNPSAIFWQAPLATDARLGEIAEIGYFVRWDLSGNVPKAQLCRFFVNPIEPDSSPPKLNPDFIYKRPDSWVTDSLLNEYAPADADSGYKGLFAENVIGLWVRCLAPDGEEIPGNAGVAGSFDSRKNYQWIDESQSPNKTVVKPAPALPASVELDFVLLDSASAERLTLDLQASIVSLAAGNENGREFINQALAAPDFAPIRSGMRLYTTRVYLQNSQ